MPFLKLLLQKWLFAFDLDRHFKGVRLFLFSHALQKLRSPWHRNQSLSNIMILWCVVLMHAGTRP